MTFNFKEFFSKKHNTQILTPHEKVAEFFVDLDTLEVSKQGGFIVDDGVNVKEKMDPAMVSVGGIPAYKKGMKNYIVNEILASKLYNHLGIYTPKVTPMINKQIKA